MLPRKAILISLSTLLILFSCKKVELNRINKITTDKISTLNTAVSANGSIIDISKEGMTKYGHCWSTNPVPTIADAKTEFKNASAGTEFTSTLTKLSANTVYYVCSYTTNGAETVYGEIKSFTISAFSTVSIVASQLQIQGESTLSVNASITDLGSLNVIDYGHCWAAHTEPTINDNKTQHAAISTDINFSSTLSGLSQETTYYVRAYLKLDDATIIYSNELSTVIPDLTVTTDSYSITGTTATLGGTIVNLGVLPVIEYGHCWSTTSSNPNYNDNLLLQGTPATTGAYFSNLPLTAGKTYYFRAFARKGNTLKYGVVKSIKF